MNTPDAKAAKNSIRIEDVLADYGVKLKPAGGGRLVGKCPFHVEKTPSFMVYVEPRSEQHATCFGCHWGGDPISLVQKLEGVDFKEAVRLLVEEHGAHNVPSRQRRAVVHKIAAVQKWWRRQLALIEEACHVLPAVRNRGYHSDDEDVLCTAIAAEKWLAAAAALSDELRDYAGPEILRFHGAFQQRGMPSIRQFYESLPPDLRVAWAVEKWALIEEAVAAANEGFDWLEEEFIDLDPALYRRIGHGRKEVLANARIVQNGLTGTGDRRSGPGTSPADANDIRPAA